MSDPKPPAEHIEQYFRYDHLPEKLQVVSKPFGDLAQRMIEVLPRNPERTVMLRKLLEAKDAAVRALIAVAVLAFLLPLEALAQTVVVDPAPAPGFLAGLLTPGTIVTVLGVLSGLFGGLGFKAFVDGRWKRRIALAAAHCFYIVEDVGNELEGPDRFDKTARYLEAVNRWFLVNGWRPPKPGELELAKMLASSNHGVQVAKAKVVETAIAAALPANPQTA